MRRAMMAASGLVFILAVAACAPSGEEVEPVLLRVADDPTVTFKVWFKVGSQDDPAGKEGLAHLTAQMIAEASTTTHPYPTIIEKLYPLASGYGIGVDREMTVLSGRTHRDNVEAYLPLFTDAFLRPAFKEEDFSRVKSDTLNYLRNTLRFQADEELGKAALYRFIFDGTSYAHPPEGTVGGVEAITLDDVRGFYASHFTRDNAELALGGGFDTELERRLSESLRELPEGIREPQAAAAAAPFEGLHVHLVAKPDADASISFGFPIRAARGDREFYALWIANSWFGEHRNSSSHLYQVIRETRGMNYGDYSYIEAFPGGGRRSVPPTHVGRRQQIFEVWIRTVPNDRAHFALRAAARELKKMVDDGLTAEQFELTRSFLSKYVLHFAETTSDRLGYALDDRFYGLGDEGHLQRFRRMMGEITLDEVNAAIRKHLQYENLKIAIVTGDADRLADALVQETPSPISYDSPKPPEVLSEDEEIARFPLGIAADHVTREPVETIFEQ